MQQPTTEVKMLQTSTIPTCKTFLRPAVEAGLLAESEYDSVISGLILLSKHSAIDPTAILTQKEAEVKLKLSRQGVENLVKVGKLPKFKVGGAIRFYLKDVMALMQKV